VRWDELDGNEDEKRSANHVVEHVNEPREGAWHRSEAESRAEVRTPRIATATKQQVNMDTRAQEGGSDVLGKGLHRYGCPDGTRNPFLLVAGSIVVFLTTRELRQEREGVAGRETTRGVWGYWALPALAISAVTLGEGAAPTEQRMGVLGNRK
jgi:hypothetical protein